MEPVPDERWKAVHEINSYGEYIQKFGTPIPLITEVLAKRLQQLSGHLTMNKKPSAFRAVSINSPTDFPNYSLT